MRELERRVLLSVLDRKWREHLYEMDYLREGIGLRAYSQRDPLVEYQREGFELFSAMMDSIKEESVGYLFNVEVQVDARRRRGAGRRGCAGRRRGPAAPTPVEPPTPSRRRTHDHRPHIIAKGLEAPQAPQKLSLLRADASTATPAPRSQADEADDEFAGVSRNELCPCGSGSKFKRCHGDPANAQPSSQA